MLNKRCWDCGRVKYVTLFYADPKRADGLQSRCKECHKAYMRNRTPYVVVESKTCGDCGLELEAAFFHRHSSSKDGLQNVCKGCKAARSHDWEQENVEKRKQQRRLRKYGLDNESYSLLVEKHGGRCAICDQERPLVIDHCHQSGKVRGLICSPCNKSLGGFEDSIARLRRAVQYLTESAD